METFTETRELVENPRYLDQKRNALAGLHDGMIDKPIVELIRTFNSLSCCFTLQCCYGHFVYSGKEDPHNLDSLPAVSFPGSVEYRIAYIAFCVENNGQGKALLDSLRRIPELDPEYVQFCCAHWFWDRQVNSYVLQVEPDRFKHEDTAVIEYREALRIERTRNAFFVRVRDALQDYDTILTTDRLRLRYLRETDIPFLIDLWTDVDMTRYTGGPRDRGFLFEEFTRAARNPREEEYDLWIVENRETGEPIGHAGFIPKTVDGTEYIEVNYYIHRAEWGRGYATEMASRLLEYAFREKGLGSVIAIIHPDNGESKRVAEKIGMEYWKTERRGEEEKLIYRAVRREDRRTL